MARPIAEGLKAAFDVVYLTVDDVPETTEPFKAVVVHKRPEGLTGRFLKDVLALYEITHALISQPLFWYSEITAEQCRAADVPITWFEDFLGGAHIYDKIGGPYTAHNEIQEFAEMFPALDPVAPEGTRFPQPTDKAPEQILGEYGADPEKSIVLFGQSEWDMSLVERADRLSYEAWMRTLVRLNPGTRFLLKEHPLYKARGLSSVAAEILRFGNVQLYTESIWATFKTFRHFAAYSSTVILEGAFLGKPFITGGRHFLDHPALSIVATLPCQFENVLQRSAGFAGSVGSAQMLRQRLSFITRFYTMKPDDPRLADRLLLSSEEFYARQSDAGAGLTAVL